MFSIRGGVIQSDAGFSVQTLGRCGMEYREGEKVMIVDSEILMGEYIAVIWKDTIRAWKPPFDKVPISQEKRDEIVTNILAAFAFKKLLVKVS